MTTTTRRRSDFGSPFLSKAFPLFLALTSSACGSPMKTPDVKQNPNPKQRYEITLKIHDAPGPFDSVTAKVGYQVVNGECVPLTPGSGATIVPREYLPLALTRVSEDSYKATLYLDRFQDEDYYGLGVCHWELMSAGFELKVGGMTFHPAIMLKEIKAGVSPVRYFSKHTYADASDPAITPFSDSGNATREEFKDPANTFSTQVTAEEKTP